MQKLIGLSGLARSGKDTAASILLSYPGVTALALADPLKLGCQALFGLTEAETWDENSKEKRIALWGKSPRQLFQQVGTDWMRSYNPDFWLARVRRMLRYPNALERASLIDYFDPRIEIKLTCQAFFLFTHEQITQPSTSRALDPYWNISPNDAFDFVERLTLASFPDWHRQRSELPQSIARDFRSHDTTNCLIIKDIRFENEADYIRTQQGQIWHIKRHNRTAVNPHTSELGIQVAPSDIIIPNDGSITDLQNTIHYHWSAIHKANYA